MPQNPPTTPGALSELTGVWHLDPERTTIQFTTKALWITTVNGTLRATEGTGTVEADAGVTGRIVIDATSIDTKNKRRDEHLRTDDFFDVTKYPHITFDLTEGHLGGPERSTLMGTLSLHGVTRPIEVHAAVQTEVDGALTLDVRTDIDRSEWGLEWTRLGAGLHNAVSIKATFVRR